MSIGLRVQCSSVEEARDVENRGVCARMMLGFDFVGGRSRIRSRLTNVPGRCSKHLTQHWPRS